jgi:glycerol kinase
MLIDEIELVDSPQKLTNWLSRKFVRRVYLVPAFAGLGAPYFDSEPERACGHVERHYQRHIARAALESIAYQNNAVVDAMGAELAELRVDGGPTRSAVLMQFQADILGSVRCSIAQEISA